MIFTGKITIHAFYRAFMKYFINPFVYHSKFGYNAELYWKNRHSKYGMNPMGAGSESFDSHENDLKNNCTSWSIGRICKAQGIEINEPVLDIGCGSGLFTNYCNSNGAHDYTGMDITDVLFPSLKKINNDYRFIKNDITDKCILGRYKTIFMIDVIEHIVSKCKLVSAMENVKKMLDNDGVFIVGPTRNENRKHFFYLHSWSTEYIMSLFEDYQKMFTPFMCGDAIMVWGK